MNEQSIKAFNALVEKWEDEGRAMEDQLRVQVGIKSIAVLEGSIATLRSHVVEVKAIIDALTTSD